MNDKEFVFLSDEESFSMFQQNFQTLQGLKIKKQQKQKLVLNYLNLKQLPTL